MNYQAWRNDMKKDFHRVSSYMSKWLFIAVLAGLGGGLCAVLLKKSIQLVAGVSSVLPLWFNPILGGVLVAGISRWDAKAAGFGTDHYIQAVNIQHEHLKPKNLFRKLIATSATLGFNGSGGVEGPMLVIGGSIASVISRIPFVSKNITKEDRRILTICGAAGAIGAIFHSPLGGGILVVELLYRSTLHYTDLFPAVLSANMGFVTYSMLAEAAPFFDIPAYPASMTNVPHFILAAVLAGLCSLLFMAVFGAAQQFFTQLPAKKYHPVLGGMITGLILVFVPFAAGTGINIIQHLILNKSSFMFLLILLGAKILATSATIASGGSAGLVVPSLMIGAIVGNFTALLIPNAGSALTALLTVTGMAASLAGAANVPIATSILLIEMVGLSVGVPATIGSIIGYAIARNKIIYNLDNGNLTDIKLLREKDCERGH